LQIVSLEDKITPDNPVRFIDAFVNHIDLNKIGFESKVLKAEGRPSFQTQVFLKLIYMVISTAFGIRKNYPKKIIETDCGIAFGTIGKSPRERERISYDWELTKNTLMLGAEREMLCIHEYKKNNKKA
jgi:hypothetical protein